jgi:gliding motility-associated-like protein
LVTPDSNTTYHVCVTTNWGCTSCDSVKVTIACNGSQVFIPNTFTPNGDGVNDKFIVSGKGLGLITRMTVFNRWGQVMYDAQNIPANDMTYGWDGTFQGQVLEPDVFMYVVEVKCETQGTSFKFHGDISLVK